VRLPAASDAVQLPGSAHDVAVHGYGFEYDYIDPAYPDAAKVTNSIKGLTQS
jgi:hypothetical protein